MLRKLHQTVAVLVLILATGLLTPGATYAAEKSIKRTKPHKADKASKEFAPLIDAAADESTTTAAKTHNIGVGLGLFSVFLPQTAIQATYIHKNKFAAGVQLGFLLIPLSEFKARSIYFGVDAKYFPIAKSSLFVGAAIGQRSLEIATKSTVTVNETVTEVFWTRTAKQMLVTPRVGWQPINTGAVASVISLGLSVPMATSFNVESEPQSIPGLTPQEYEDEKTRKGNDVSTFTNKPMPHIELSLFWYLGLPRRS